MPKLSHTNARGEAQMVDVSQKSVTSRVAAAQVEVHMKSTTLDQIYSDDIAKGDVLPVARIAGIQAAKRTSELIPLCHPLSITKVEVDFERVGRGELAIIVRCKTDAKTGVEMEAMTAASVAALTVYDMCKGVEKGIRIESLRLLEKSGGKSGTWKASEA